MHNLTTLRETCGDAIREQGGNLRAIMFERAEGDSYGALFMGEDQMIMAIIPDIYAARLEVYLTEAEIKK